MITTVAGKNGKTDLGFSRFQFVFAFAEINNIAMIILLNSVAGEFDVIMAIAHADEVLPL